MENKEIVVSGCHDCPFSKCDYDGTLQYYCEHFIRRAMNINSCYESESLHKSCPLKEQSITIKLKDNEISN